MMIDSMKNSCIENVVLNSIFHNAEVHQIFSEVVS